MTTSKMVYLGLAILGAWGLWSWWRNRQAGFKGYDLQIGAVTINPGSSSKRDEGSLTSGGKLSTV